MNGRGLVVIPALNEAASVAGVVAAVRAAVPAFDILVVDDGSTDGTAMAAAEAGALVCRLPFNLGVGGAMRTAFKFAHRSGYDVVVQVDGDGQHDPTYIPDLVERLDEADLVIGARFAGLGDYRTSVTRRLAMRVLATVLSRIVGQHLTDVTSGFRAMGPRCIELFAVHYPAEYLGDTVESAVIAVRAKCRVCQAPVVMSAREAGLPSQSTIRSAAFLGRAFVALGLAMVRNWPLPELGSSIRSAHATGDK